jgi:hypothetical protein
MNSAATYGGTQPGAPPMPLRDSIYDSLSRRLFDDLFLFNLAAMLVGMVLSRFTGMVGRLEPVSVSDMGVVRRFLVVAGFMVHGSFAMMSCRVFVVFCALLWCSAPVCILIPLTFLSMTKLANPGNSPCRSILALKVTPGSLTA